MLSALSSLAGILGLFLSLFLLIRDNRRERCWFDLDIIDYSSASVSTRLYLCVVNRSHRPLVITSFVLDGTTCELDPKKIRSSPESWNFQHTPQFPVAIPALDARMFYIEFVGPSRRQLSPGIPVTLQIQTSFRLESRTLFLGKPARYLNNIR